MQDRSAHPRAQPSALPQLPQAQHDADAHRDHDRPGPSHRAHAHDRPEHGGAQGGPGRSQSEPEHSRGGHGGHGHGGHGGHGHGGHGAHGAVSDALSFSILLNVGFVGVELFYGLSSGSAALLSDALHNLGDVLALVVAWGAQRLARRPASSRRTYGFRRVTIWAGLVNGAMLMLAVGGLGWESLRRLGETRAIDAKTVTWVAAVGVLVNGLSAWSLAKQSKGDVNMRAAFMHMAADMGVSLSVVLGGVLMTLFGILWLDPVLSLLVVLLTAWSCVALLREAFELALDAVPSHIDPRAVADYLKGLAGVNDVHDLHVWSLSTTEVALTVHLVLDWPPVPPAFLSQLDDELLHRFGIHHTTVQIEPPRADCRGAVPH